MFCDEFLDHVDAIAAGDFPLDARARAHLATCPGCTAAWNDAQEVERLLKARPAPQAPPQFTARIMGRIRGDRWRREQFIDTGFNVVMGIVVLAVIGALWMLFSQSGISSVTGDAVNLLNASARQVIGRAAPSLPLYLGAFAALATALGLWWWAEQKSEI
jgi:Zn-finger nucleic acid-binding protein